MQEILNPNLAFGQSVQDDGKYDRFTQTIEPGAG